MRVLGVDFGRQRIGLAIGESEFEVVTPRKAIAATGTLKKDAEAITQFARTEEAELIVLGVPVYEDNPRMQNVMLRLADEMRALGTPVETVDESLSSVAADAVLKESDLTAAGRKARLDSEAACQILLRYYQGRKI